MRVFVMHPSFLNQWRKIMWGVALVLLLCLGCLWSFYDHPASLSTTDSFQEHVVFRDFSLTDQHGKTFRFRDGSEPFVFLYFGYTYCPDICPLALTHMTQALQRLEPAERARIQTLFVTVDPERDTETALSRYASLFHPNITYLTGAMDQVDSVLKAYGVFSQKVQPDGTSTEYLVDHSSMIYWMKRDGTLLGRFAHTTPPALLVDAIRSCGIK